MVVKIKLKKGDKVIVVAGKNKGDTGEVLKIFPEKNKANRLVFPASTSLKKIGAHTNG